MPRISAFDIHGWIHDQLYVPKVTMILIDGLLRQVYIKFKEIADVQEILQSTNGQSEYKHANGKILQLRIEMA